MKQFRDLSPEAIEALADHLLEELAGLLHDAGVSGSEHVPGSMLGRRLRGLLRAEHALARRSGAPIQPIRSGSDGN